MTEITNQISKRGESKGMKIKQHLCDPVKVDTKILTNNHLITTSRSWQKVGNIMSRDVAVIAPDESTVTAAKLMSEKNLSSIVVLDDNDRIVGILTEMDFLKRVTSTNRKPDKTAISEIMSKPVETIGIETTVLDASIIAKTKGIKRLPIVDENGKLAEDESSEDQRCSDCHELARSGNKPVLMKAFHASCKGCHKEKKKGPVICGQCHVKGNVE